MLDIGEEATEIEHIFPELAESEDEKIRKSLVEYFESHHDDTTFFGSKVIDILSWLEKQGELVSSLTKALDNAHERIDKLIQEKNKLISQLEKKQGEQKPAWSEEDETMVDDIVSDISKLKNAEDRESVKILYAKEVDWLKSLKDRIGG